MLKNFLLSLVGLLFYFLPIAHTIAIRNIVFYLLFLSCIFLIWKYKDCLKFFLTENLNKIIYILFGLTVYIFFHSIFLSVDRAWSLDEFRGQWIVPILYFFVGFSLAIIFISNKKLDNKLLVNVVFYAMFLHILYLDLNALKVFIDTKTLVTRATGLTDAPVLLNYLTNTLLAFIVSEIIYRIRTKGKILFISNYALFVVTILVIISSIIEGMRNGVIAVLFLGIMTVFFLFYENNKFTKRVKLFSLLTIFFILIIPLFYNLKNDSRWHSLYETIPIALDTTNNKFWLNHNKYEMPKLSNGKNISESNYERIAWLYEGSILISENPIGIGFSRNSFGMGLELKYDDGRGMHSHSSIIDFTLGVGLIGLFLWLFFLFYLTKKSIVFFKEKVNFFSMVTFFLVTGFFTRSLVDSNMRDHMFLQFMFLLGMSILFMFYENKKYKNEKTKIN